MQPCSTDRAAPDRPKPCHAMPWWPSAEGSFTSHPRQGSQSLAERRTALHTTVAERAEAAAEPPKETTPQRAEQRVPMVLTVLTDGQLGLDLRADEHEQLVLPAVASTAT
jgi:hypothetical protein